MRILMATFSLTGPRLGGAERQATLLSDALLRRGHHVEHVSADLKRGTSHHGDILVNGLPGVVMRQGKRRAQWPRFALALARFLMDRRGDFDLVHCHGAFDASSPVLGLMAPWLNLPVVLKHASGDEYRILRRRTRLPEALARTLHARCATHVTNNLVISWQLRTDRQFAPRLVEYIPNGVPLPDQTVSLDAGAAPRLVCVSNFNKNKNQRALVQAWPELRRRLPDAQLTFAGTGALLEDCRALAADLGVADSVHFKGFVHDIPALLQEASLFVFPSRHKEGMPNVLLEAMAAGLPSVVLHQPALHNIIHDDVEGFVIHQDHPSAFADAVERALTPSTWARLSAQARRSAEEHYAMEHITDRYLDLYQRTLAAQSARA